MVTHYLFPKGIPNGCAVTRMEGKVSDHEASARNYEKLIPISLYILILSVGTEGHIASLFPGSAALQENT